MVQLFYTTCVSVDHAHYEVVRANVGNGGTYLKLWRLKYKLQFALNSSPESKGYLYDD